LDLAEPVRTILSGPVGWDGLLLSKASPWKPNTERIRGPTHRIEHAPQGQWGDCPLTLRTKVLDVPLTVDVAVGLNWVEAH
jgi:hypothetical protein